MRHLKTFLIAGLALATAFGQPAKSYKDLKFPPLGNIEAPKHTKFVMPNGMTVFLIEDHELPTFGGFGMIRTGARLVPANKAGLAGMTGSVMRTGGSTTMKGDEIDDKLDKVGASLETSISVDSGTIGFNGLKEDMDLVLPIAADLLRNPAFPQDKIELAKTQSRDSISRRNENPQGILGREFGKLIYGKDSPYARQPEYATINAITREDMLNFHKQYFQPENVVLAVWGDFTTADMRARIEKLFGSWPKGGNPKPVLPTLTSQSNGGLYVVNKDDVNQSQIQLGALGGKLNDEEYAANLVAAEILGGGFSSRLFNRVRTKEGYAYSTYAVWAANYDRPGLYLAGAGTKSESTAAAIAAIKEEISRLSAADVTDRELQGAKDSILKGQAFDFDSTGKVASRLVRYEYFGYPEDFLQQTQNKVRTVTKADVAKVAKKYWQPEKLTVLVVGKTSEFGTPLTGAKPIDISIPQPEAPKTSAATPASLDKGKSLLTRMATAMGASTLADVKTYVVKGNTQVQTPQGAMSLSAESSYRVPNQMAQKIQTPGGEITLVFDGQKMWVKTPAGVQDAPAQQIADTQQTMFRETLNLLRNAANLKAQSLGASKVGEKAVEEILVTDASGKLQVRLLIDPQTGMLAGKRYTGQMMGGPGEIEEQYTEYKEFAGLKLPVATTVTQNGAKRAESKIEDVRLNAAVEDTLFVR